MTKNKHIFEIKDFVASDKSALHVLDDIVSTLEDAAVDIEIAKINVFVNDSTLCQAYIDKGNADNKIKIDFIPTLPKKQTEKRTFATFHNSVISHISQNDLNDKSVFVHIVDGGVNLHNIPAEQEGHQTRIGEMIDNVTEMMRLLKYSVWFNTASDKANLNFGHYYTRLDIINIEPQKVEGYPPCIMYSGNSNLDWIIVDNEMCSKKPDLMMNSKYDFDFLSVKQLIAKFAATYPGYFMSLFPTVPLEPGAYSRNIAFDRDLTKYDMSKYQQNIDAYQKNISAYNIKGTGNVIDAMKYVRSVIGKENDNDNNASSLTTEESLISNLVN